MLSCRIAFQDSTYSYSQFPFTATSPFWGGFEAEAQDAIGKRRFFTREAKGVVVCDSFIAPHTITKEKQKRNSQLTDWLCCKKKKKPGTVVTRISVNPNYFLIVNCFLIVSPDYFVHGKLVSAGKYTYYCEFLYYCGLSYCEFRLYCIWSSSRRKEKISLKPF